MAQVVYAERAEELASLVQKLEAIQEEDLVLLVPKGTIFLEDPLHWNLVQRQARSLGKRVVVVTRDREARHAARRAGFPVYRSLRRLKFKSGQDHSRPLTPFMKKGRGSSLAAALGTVGLGSLLLLAVGGYLVVPTGTLTMKPVAQEIALTISVAADRQVKEVDISANRIPARLIETPLEGIETVDVTGRKRTPGKAQGEVTFLNRSPSRVSVPPLTLLGAGLGTQFVTLDQVVLPVSGGTARTRVLAVTPGPAGNVGSMAIDRALEPPYASALAVWNELPTSGGLEEDTPVITAQDQSNLRSRLTGKLAKEGQERLFALRGDSESIYASTIFFSPTEEAFDKEVGTEAASLTLRMKASVSGLAFDGMHVNTLAQRALEAQALEGFRLLPRSLEVAPLEAYDWGEGWVSFRVLAKAKASIVVDGDKLGEALRGKNPSEAQEYLNWRFPQREQLTLQVKPVWLEWVPIYLWKVEVKY